MLQTSELLSLLKDIIKASCIELFWYFPDVIKFGKQRMEPEQFNYLLAEGYITEIKSDSFGKTLRLSLKAECLLRAAVG